METPVPKPRPHLPPGPYLVVGLARSGRAAAQLLAARGETVLGCDRGKPAGTAGLARAGVEVHLDTDGLELLDSAATVVKSPGVPAEAPVIAAARDRDRTVIGELDLAWRLLPGPVVGVTGTNGKTTTCEMIGHTFRRAGRKVAVAGNIGQPVADLAGSEPGADTVVICETSSFQLEDSELFAPECAVFLNLAPDHLDRHGSWQAYREAKLRIFDNQAETDVAVLNGEDPAMPERTRARQLRFCPDRQSGKRPQPRGAACDIERTGTMLTYRGEPLLELSEFQLLGAHNQANAMAAAACCLAMGLSREQVQAGLSSFTGVAHRLEPVAEAAGVLYVNDSKATNVAAAATALRSFAGPIHAILGGSLKGEGFEGLVEPVAENCAGCYLIGPAAEPIQRTLEAGFGRLGSKPRPALRRCADLTQAVGLAAAAANAGEVVLLAPGCASFDAFRDYEQRGERFRELARGLS